MIARMGEAAVDRFARLYVAPGMNHGGSGVSGTTGRPIPQYVDLLGVLDRWVVQGQAPPDTLTLTAYGATSPFVATGSRPMCRYPNFPKYGGSGDSNEATSFICTTR
jgi:feruloyl esterase